MNNKILNFLCITMAVILIASGVICAKLVKRGHIMLNILPTVDTLVIEADGAVVYN